MTYNFKRYIVELCDSVEDCECRYKAFNEFVCDLGATKYDSGNLYFGYKYLEYKGDRESNDRVRKFIRDVLDPDTEHIRVCFMTRENLNDSLDDNWDNICFSYLDDLRTIYSSDSRFSPFMTINHIAAGTGFRWIASRGRYELLLGNMPKGDSSPVSFNTPIKNVIFNGPATIVFWKDGTKTVSICRDGDTYSQETGLAICFMKKALGKRKNFDKVISKWVTQPSKKPSLVVDGVDVDSVIEALKKGDLSGAGKIITDGKKEVNNVKATL